MRLYRLVLGAGVAAVLASCGASSPAAPSSGRPPIAFKVMTFNIQHGIDGTPSGRYDLQHAIDVIARVQPDVVGLQEVTRNHPFYNCDDQPAKISAGVSAETGMQWTVVYRQEWFTPDVSCRDSGRGDGPETEGLVILSRRAIGSATTTALPDGRLGLETPVNDAYGVPFVVTHLASGSSLASVRGQELNALLGWAAGFGQPQILVGDFNGDRTAPELQPAFAQYHDAWTDAVSSGHAIGSGLSHGTTNIDYVFYLPGPSLTLLSAEVVDTVALIGIEASDHRPIVATFMIR